MNRLSPQIQLLRYHLFWHLAKTELWLLRRSSMGWWVFLCTMKVSSDPLKKGPSKDVGESGWLRWGCVAERGWLRIAGYAAAASVTPHSIGGTRTKVDIEDGRKEWKREVDWVCSREDKKDTIQFWSFLNWSPLTSFLKLVPQSPR